MDQTNVSNKKIPDANQISSPSKEREFTGRSDSLIKELSQELELPKEVKQTGITSNKEKIEIPPDLQSIGLTHTGMSTSVNYTPTLKLPLEDEKILTGKKSSVFSSVRWLAEWCLLQLKRFHMTIKVIHGKVMRVRYKS